MPPAPPDVPNVTPAHDLPADALTGHLAGHLSGHLTGHLASGVDLLPAAALAVAATPDLTLLRWALVGFVALLAGVAIMHTVGCVIRDETAIHMLRVRTVQVHRAYMEYLRKLKGDYSKPG